MSHETFEESLFSRSQPKGGKSKLKRRIAPPEPENGSDKALTQLTCLLSL